MIHNKPYCPKVTENTNLNEPKVIKFTLYKSSESLTHLGNRCKSANLESLRHEVKCKSKQSKTPETHKATSCPTSARKEVTTNKQKHAKISSETRNGPQKPASKCFKAMETALKNLEHKFKSYEAGDYVPADGKVGLDANNINSCLNNFGQSIKLNSSTDNCNVKLFNLANNKESSSPKGRYLNESSASSVTRERSSIESSLASKKVSTSTELSSSLSSSRKGSSLNESSSLTKYRTSIELSSTKILRSNESLSATRGKVLNESASLTSTKVRPLNKSLKHPSKGDEKNTNSNVSGSNEIIREPSVNVIFEDTKMAKEGKLNVLSEDSIVESSGYQTTNNFHPNSLVDIADSSMNGIKSFTSDIHTLKDHCHEQGIEHTTEKLKSMLIEIFGCDSQIANLLQNSCNSNPIKGETIFDEIAKSVEQEMKFEEKLMLYFKKKQFPNLSTIAETLSNNSENTNKNLDIKNLEESLKFVVENLTSIKHDLSDFKENCWSKIDSNVNKTEFHDTTNELKTKIYQLEKKVALEHKIIKQEILNCRQSIKVDSGSDYGFKKFPLWTFVAFVGAYSLMYLGNKT